MVLHKLRSGLAQRKVLLGVGLTTSAPRISLSAAEDEPFHLILSIRIVSRVDPGRPVTICTQGSAFRCTSEGLDALASPAFSNLLNISNGDRHLPLGLDLLPVRHYYSPPPWHLVLYQEKFANLLLGPALGKYYNSPHLGKREQQCITILGDGNEVRVSHDFSLKRMFKYAEGVKKDDLRPGERYRVFVTDGYVGTRWWCWGSIDANLKGKKLCAWAKGAAYFDDIPKPSEEDIEKKGYVFGEDIEILWFEGQPEGGGFVEFEFVA